MTRDRKLQKIYDKLPKLNCQGKCIETCSVIPVHPRELRQIRKHTGKRIRAKGDPVNSNFRILRTVDDFVCELLKDGWCSVYPVRPLMCRLYGLAEGLECSFGCKPDRMLTRDESHALLNELNELKGF